MICPYNPAIPLLGIHTEETRIERDTCTPVFTAALFTIARTQKQPRCPLTFTSFKEESSRVRPMTWEERVRTELEREGAAGVRLKVLRAGLGAGGGG